MHKKFNHEDIEKKWQKDWKERGIYNVGERDLSKEKEYILVEWPYPSGNLHVGHWFAFAVVDIYVRARRMQGKQVLFPMGFDAFGLPAENAAIKRNLDPKAWTDSNIEYMRNQLESMGNAFSWDKTTSSTDPEYYKWTQWMFTQFYEKGIAYRGTGSVNWCPGCNTVIANEQVLTDGTCERSGDSIEKRQMPQWMLRITQYADRLIDDLDTLNWPPHIKEAQRQWIGRSEGARIEFPLTLPSFSGDIVFATNNQGKVERMRKLAKASGLNITIKTPADIGIVNFSVEEDEPTLDGNVEKKARELSKLTDLPVFADDSGFYIEGEEINPVTVKRNALGDKKESDLTTLEVGTLMAEYYKKIATAHGGEVKAEWRNALCFAVQGSVKHAEAVRPVILTNEIHGTFDPHLPLRSMYKPVPTGKYVDDQTEEEELLELKPITDALKRLLTPTIEIFTTRPDTLYGATYMVLAPEHPWVTLALDSKHDVLENKREVAEYVKIARDKSEIERTNKNKEKTGVELKGVRAINPATGKEIPLFVADYVLAGYGTGAIMAVPAHDERDFEFARKYNLPVKATLKPSFRVGELIGEQEEYFKRILDGVEVFTSTDGELVDSEEFSGMSSEEAKEAITKKVGGKMTNTYRLRDWSIGRQRYWGVPIPIVYDPEGKTHTIPKEHLPWLLPTDVDFRPTGVPPLAKSDELKERVEKIFGKGWTPEVETMDTFVDSSWYFLRYLDNKNENDLSSLEKQNQWMPIDTYFGGSEHTTMHLLYSRFWQKALFDLGLVTLSEPYTMRINRGLVLGPDGNKMSKSKGNVIDPDEQVKRLGADTVKMYLAFMGPYGEASNYPWSIDGIVGQRRFLERVYGLAEHIKEHEDTDTTKLLHKTIKKVTEDINEYKFNTAISALMIFINHGEKVGLSVSSYKTFLQLLAPFAPHLTEELWHSLGETSSIHVTTWPVADRSLLTDETVSLSVQINGKMRGLVTIPNNADEATTLNAVKNDPLIAQKITGEIIRVIFVKNKIVNLILKGP